MFTGRTHDWTNRRKREHALSSASPPCFILSSLGTRQSALPHGYLELCTSHHPVSPPGQTALINESPVVINLGTWHKVSDHWM